ncbi:MAG: NUDIX domain-containing protein [Bacteroidota bacterium]|nr:NUDIX domain-containing protein [Bacteroidota bacterium]MDP4230267.1 NUDIX domain-containing protein [Bacteroidota bacterium]MDP4236113.1 NUDIX domain-containing protein [Bacteroidota bacterium]
MAVRVVTGLLIRDGTILMCLRRTDKPFYPLHWEFPGGKVESGESLVQALERELREELLISLTTATPWFDDIMTYSNGMTYHVTFFLVRDFQGEPVNTEFADIKWFAPEELRSLQHLSGNANILQKILSEGIPK